MIRAEGNVSSILVTCRSKPSALNHYVPALRKGGWRGEVHVVAPGDSLPPWEDLCALVLTGGADIHPCAWDGEEPLHPAAEADGERDDLELPLIREAWGRRLPILGICRGEQALNVALGGSLHQDLPSTFGCAPSTHRQGSSDLPPMITHEVRVEPDTRLHRLVGCTQFPVNSRHHQAVKRLAPGLRAVAWHDATCLGDEILVEAVEAADHDRWVVGVQWHPENLVNLENEAGEAARRIFQGFIAALER